MEKAGADMVTWYKMEVRRKGKGCIMLEGGMDTHREEPSA